jgi:hypothetical protein
MAAAPRMKLADKQEIYKKVLSGLKKRYPSVSKLPELPVLETMLFAVCLENANVTDADAAYKRLTANFHDLNEVRVSSIEELEAVFHGMSTPDWRAMRIRGILGHVFESTYSFEFDGLKRKTLELATKQLSKIKELTPFVRDYTLHATLGAHVIPLDDVLLHSVEFLDLHADAGGLEATAESLRPLVRKAEGTEFSGLLREFATDPKLRPTITIVRQAVVDGAILPPALARFEKLLKGEQIKFDPPPKKSVEKKEAERKETERKENEKKELERKELERKEKETVKAVPSKFEAGKKPDATKVEHAKAEASKTEAAKLEHSKTEQSKSKSGNNKVELPKAEIAKPESSKHEASKIDHARADHTKLTHGKGTPAIAKSEKKSDVVVSDKNSKSAAGKPAASKSGKPEPAKVSSGKPAVAASPKVDQTKSKSPAKVTKKEPVVAAKKEAPSKAVGSSKSATKAAVPTPPAKSSSKPSSKPAVDLKATKKPTSKSGK